MKNNSVLSLFNGFSCGYIALQMQGIEFGNYYSSEIDKYAIKASNIVYEDTIQLGNVKYVNIALTWNDERIKKIFDSKFISIARKKNIKKCIDELRGNEVNIKYLFAGFPCQSWSLAGNMQGDSDDRGKLMWVMLSIFNHLKKHNPNLVFLFENVRMKKEFMVYCSKAIGVSPILINASLVSAQNRERYYWTNIGVGKFGLFQEQKCLIQQPKDRKILLRDILERQVDDKYYVSQNMLKNIELWNDRGNGIVGHSGTGGQKGFIFNENTKASCLCATEHKQPKQILLDRDFIKVSKDLKQKPNQDKASCFTAGANSGGNHSDMDLLIEVGTLRTHNDGKGFRKMKEEKSPTLNARARQDGSGQPIVSINLKVRRITPREAFRLQSVPEYIIDKLINSGISDTRLYQLAGNGWNCEVISYILSYLK